MYRAAKLLVLLLPVAALWSCNDECTNANDCKSSEVCYKGFCQVGRLEQLTCAVDNDCGPDPGAGQERTLICVGTRCIANPNVIGGPPPVVNADAMPDTGAMDAVAPPPDTGAPDNGTPDLGLADTGTTTGTTTPDAGIMDTGTATTSTTADGGPTD